MELGRKDGSPTCYRAIEKGAASPPQLQINLVCFLSRDWSLLIIDREVAQSP